MDKTIDSVRNTESIMYSQQKSLTPAILGIPSGLHGAKLSSNMNLKDKEDLLLKLEAWRQARKEKLTATVLAKGKPKIGSTLPSTLPRPKIRRTSHPPMGTDANQNQCDNTKSVFDRLYENASKVAVKKTEENRNEKLTGTKSLHSIQHSKYPQSRKPKVPKVILMGDDYCGTSSEGTPGDITSSVPVVQKVSGEQGLDDIEKEVDSADGLLEDTPQETVLSVIEEKAEKIQDEVSAETHNVESVLVETLQETSLSVPAEGDILVSRNEVCAEVDGLRKDDEDNNFDVKKNVSFETLREKILSAVHLRNKLEEWLSENGHSIDAYKHLRCFGLNAEKTPARYHRLAKTDNFPNSSFYSTAPNTPATEMIDESDKENVTPTLPAPKIDIKDVEGWLGDLHRLIVHVEYPSDRCEEWLNAITKKFPNCTQLPIYWECLAAMNGNFNGLRSTGKNEESETREGEDNETSLAGMLDKLVIDEKCQSASKTERGLSVKNIFRSKAVKFVLHEKAVKELDPELGKEARRKVLVATPVRRSARLQTPDKSNIIGSLQSLDPETRRSVSFQPNDALLTG